ncbi:MAG: YfhO family protein [Ignavibacteriae bacterium]|nr:YfhO family protein [Ignavibacteriota bacterium]
MAKSKKAPPLREKKGESIFSTMSPTTQDLFSILFLYIITLFLFRGIVFENAAFSAEGDTANAISYAKAGDTIKEAEGIDPVWMPFFFSGMPTFGNVHYVPHDVSYLQKAIVGVLKLLYLNSKWGWFPVFYLLCGVFMFFLLRVWKFSSVAALLAALIYMLSPYTIGLAGEGHGSKLMAVTYLPLVFLLTHMLFEKRTLLSFGLLAASIGTLLLTNHMQIVYYVFIVLGSYLLYHLILDFKQDRLLVAKKVALFVSAMLIGFCISSYIYLSVYEYAQYSIRGGGTAGAAGGLTWEYATNWSWNPWEILTLFIPSFFGFSSSYPYAWQGNTQSLPLYWGTMPFTNSTVYVGLIPIILSVVAVVYRRNKITVFFAILTGIMFLMSFGKHFPLFYEILFNNLPFFNKFRVPVMILHLLPFTVAILGAFGFEFLLEAPRKKDFNLEKFKRALLYVGGVISAVLVFGLLFKSTLYETLEGFMFVREGESYGQQTPQIIAQLKQIRFDVLWKDYVKFVVIADLSIAAIMMYMNKKIQAGAFSALLIAILAIDLIIIDVRFIRPTPDSQIEQNFQPDATIQFLKKQKGPFRVFPLGELFMDNTYAYHGLESIGGYSPAKLKIYQTMIDSCLYNGPEKNFPLNMHIVNMLNVKYLVARGQLPSDNLQPVNVDDARRTITYYNPGMLPRAFFVGNAVIASNQSEVFTTMNSSEFNPSNTAVLEEPLPIDVRWPDTASVAITEYKSTRITVRAVTSSPALLVLSETYYPAGWKAFVDGVETAIFKTNYILRSVIVPAGDHEVMFKFEPTYYNGGWMVTNVAWGVTAICVLLGLWRTPSVRARLGAKPSEQGDSSS